MMRISEIYESRQGEGLLTGTPSVFLRTSGCNLRCSFCDTPFASWHPEGNPIQIDEIIATVNQFDVQHIVITGGEPMLPRDIVPLTERLRKSGKHITIETAGTIYRPVQCDLISISPKTSNSTPVFNIATHWTQRHESTRLNIQTLNQLMARCPYQLKFVIDRPDDLDEIQKILDQLDHFDPTRVLLMPQGIDQPSLAQRELWLRPLCEQHGLVFCPRKHIEWYGNRRGT